MPIAWFVGALLAICLLIATWPNTPPPQPPRRGGDPGKPNPQCRPSNLVCAPPPRRARLVVAVEDLCWAASPRGSSILHLLDDGTPLCGRTLPGQRQIARGFLPTWRWPGYLLCQDCPHHVELDEHAIAEPRHPLAVDELPTRHRAGRHSIDTLAAPPQHQGGVSGRRYRPGTPPTPDRTQTATPRLAA